ncbi:unnamed protein product [Schistosoma margrebowiei]|uniref:Uncharacterized protein n=1 Tax=Schistosoma margrebowiei TaxID=48269 RepID=A0A3P7WMS4_9TREM|nr:unnamed protein product [Schistosoma margrebowiei]
MIFKNRKVECFEEPLNRPAPLNPPNIETAPTDFPIDVTPPTIEEVRMDIRLQKNHIPICIRKSFQWCCRTG